MSTDVSERLSIPEAAQAAGVTRQAIWKALEQGRLQGERIREVRGWVWLIERTEFERWMQNR